MTLPRSSCDNSERRREREAAWQAERAQVLRVRGSTRFWTTRCAKLDSQAAWKSVSSPQRKKRLVAKQGKTKGNTGIL